MLHDCPVGDSRGQAVVFVPRDRYMSVMKKLVDDGFTMCMDLTAVDYLTHPGRTLPDGVAAERFEVVLNLLSMQRRERLRVRVQVPVDNPSLESEFE